MTLFGIDISNNNFGGPTNVNTALVAPLLEAVATAGFSWVEMKCSQGSDFIDPYWSTVYAWCQANNMPIAAYHYLDTTDPAAQATNCAQALAGADVALMFDFEANSGGYTNFQACQQAFAAAGLTLALSYIPQWYWDQEDSPAIPGAPGLISSAYPSTAAGYASTLYEAGGGDSGEGWTGYGGDTPVIWQFTDNATIDPAGQYTGIDANAFKGTPAQLAALLSTTPTPTPAPTPGVFMALTDAQQLQLLNAVLDIQIQLRGIPGAPDANGDPTFTGWPQLGQNSQGQDNTLVDGVSANLAATQTALSTVEAVLGDVSKGGQQ